MSIPNISKPIMATKNVPAVSHLEGDLTQQTGKTDELTASFFLMPYEQKDEVVRPLLCEASKHCCENNISPENLPAALTTVLTLYSVPLGYPMAIILKADDPMIVQHFLTVLKKITPKKNFIEVRQLFSKQFYRNQDAFKDKAIICHNPKNCKNAIRDIQNLILHRYSSKQELYKSDIGDELKEVCIQYSIGFIGVEIGDEKFDLNDPSILRITLSANENQRELTVPGDRIFQKTHEESSSATRKIIREFERLSPRAVHIPYENQISFHFIKQRVEKIQLKLKPVQNLLSLLAISNNPPLFTLEEAKGYCRGHTPHELHPIIASGTAFTATKVEYAQMAQLLKDIIPIKEEHFTRIQIIIFEAVKMINLGKLKGSVVDQRNEAEVLLALHNGNVYWAELGDIFRRVNSNGGKTIPIPVIDKELNKLHKLGIIAKRKFPQKSDYGYYINDISIGKRITFQKASEINDPKFNMTPVKVKNPLTGKIQTI